MGFCMNTQRSKQLDYFTWQIFLYFLLGLGFCLLMFMLPGHSHTTRNETNKLSFHCYFNCCTFINLYLMLWTDLLLPFMLD